MYYLFYAMVQIKGNFTLAHESYTYLAHRVLPKQLDSSVSSTCIVFDFQVVEYSSRVNHDITTSSIQFSEWRCRLK